MIPTAILIHGRKGVGKDTLGRHLYLQHGYFQTALADVLRLYLENANPPLLDDAGNETRLNSILERVGGWDEAKRLYPEVRTLMTGFGQAARNVFGQDFWVEQYTQKVTEFREEFPYVTHFVVTDIRYANELDLLRDYFGPGARAVKLVRDHHDADGHPSEEGLADDLFDMVIENNASPGDLFAKIRLTLEIWDGEEVNAA